MKIHVTIGLPVLYSDIILLNADTIDGTMILHNKFNSDSRPNHKYLELFDCGTDTEVGRRFTRLWTVSASLTFTDSNALKFLLHLLNTLKKMTKTFIFSFVTSYSVLHYIHLKLSNMKNKMGCLIITYKHNLPEENNQERARSDTGYEKNLLCRWVASWHNYNVSILVYSTSLQKQIKYQMSIW